MLRTNGIKEQGAELTARCNAGDYCNASMTALTSLGQRGPCCGLSGASLSLFYHIRVGQ